ncbi:hypothetical protein EX30DRAFT_342206 [Ascodesmis nigricans]|uniref:N-acetyltransferase domain-containing protein n=1 Tax=Ascodesmis nigricans TaxID=341454 RepID=A0A4S2MSX0_9PEZI|nr:hypothetical protein EX30DRAFT_342206 [Ascodesmis nigricans]
MLYVDVNYQRQGAGQLLMDWGVSKADELGYSSLIESTRSGKPLYERNGYTGERKHLAVPEKWLWRTPVQYWLMYRPARTAGKVNGVNGTNGVNSD